MRDLKTERGKSLAFLAEACDGAMALERALREVGATPSGTERTASSIYADALRRYIAVRRPGGEEGVWRAGDTPPWPEAETLVAWLVTEPCCPKVPGPAWRHGPAGWSYALRD